MGVTEKEKGKMQLDIKSTTPSTLVGRIAPHVAAITAAREKGITWPVISRALAETLGVPVAAGTAKRVRQGYIQARAAIEKGRLKPRPAGAVPARAAPKPNLSGTPGGFQSVLGAPGGGEELPPPPFGGGFEKL